MEQVPSEVNPLFIPAIIKSRQSGGIRVNMWGVGGEPGTPECEHFYIEVENVGDPDDKEFNFSLWGPDMIALAAGVVAFDLLAPETMSNAFRRGLKNHELLTLGAWVVTSAHLLDILPEEIDPFKHLHRETN